MTVQAQLKVQAYNSDLKSRALSVLIYLIDRTNKELTCFPAISTIAEQLHISISTVKRAMRELSQEGYIEKSARFRENKGQTSNLYTLVLKDNKADTENQDRENQKKAVPVKKQAIAHITFESIRLEQNSNEKKEFEESISKKRTPKLILVKLKIIIKFVDQLEDIGRGWLFLREWCDFKDQWMRVARTLIPP